MLNICSLFQKFFGFIKSISKKTYRDAMIISAGIILVAVIVLGANDFGGSGKNNTNKNQDKGENEVFTEENDTDANALSQNLLFDFNNTNEEISSEIVNGRLLGFTKVINSTENKMFYEVQSSASIEAVSADTVALPEVQETETVTEAVTEEVVEVVEETEEISEEETEVETEEETEAEEVYSYTSVDFEVTDSDYYWFLRIVEAEAGDQDELGRIMVANVIINRVNSGYFPNSIKSVIFQNDGYTYQFEPVKNERIYDAYPSQTTIDAVDRALSGEDYSEGALFFTMRTSSYSWFNTSLELLFVHGDHYFYTY